MRPYVGQLAGAALLAVSLQLASCATQTVTTTPENRNTSSAIALIAARDRTLTSLQTSAVMEYTGPNGHLKAREQITVRRPASLRVEALSPLGVALVVAADANAIAVFDPSQNVIARGPANAATLAQVARIPLAPTQAVRLLLALPPDATPLTAPAATAADNGVTTLSYTHLDGAVEVELAEGNLVLVRKRTAAGAIAYEVHYSDYRDIGPMKFPYVIEADFPAAGTTIKLRYDRPLVDGVIPDAAFVLLPGPQTKELRLGSETAPSGAHG